MITDVHAHYLPPRVLAELEREPGRYGVGLERLADGRSRLLFPGAGYTRPVLPALLDLDARRRQLDRLGIGHQVLATWMDAVGYALPGATGARWARLSNESLAEALREPEIRRRFSGLATVPLQDGSAAAEELAHAVQTLGLRGVQVGTNVLGQPLDAPGLDPFWQAAAALHVPVVLHPWHVAGEDRMARHGMVRLVGYPADTTLAASALVFGGVAERYPDLRIVLVHAGGFYPYQAGRLEHGHRLRPEGKPGPGPLDALRWFHYDTITHLPAALRYLVELVGPERVMLGSDAPFDVGDPDPLGSLRAAGLGEATEQTIARANPAALFGLPS